MQSASYDTGEHRDRSVKIIDLNVSVISLFLREDRKVIGKVNVVSSRGMKLTLFFGKRSHEENRASESPSGARIKLAVFRRFERRVWRGEWSPCRRLCSVRVCHKPLCERVTDLKSLGKKFNLHERTFSRRTRASSGAHNAK